jgi:ketosteroid isomerase-like protein
LSARGEIENLLYRYAWGFDADDVEMQAGCFTEDGEVVTPAGAVAGRDAIRAMFAERRADRASRGEQPRHVTTNVLILEETDDEASVRSYFTLCIGSGDTINVERMGWYEDRLVNDAGAWKIARREMHS